MSECKSQHADAYGGRCRGVEGHAGDHWAFSRHGAGYKFRWPQEKSSVTMRYTTTAEVPPEYVRHYLDDGWTIVDNDEDRGAA